MATTSDGGDGRFGAVIDAMCARPGVEPEDVRVQRTPGREAAFSPLEPLPPHEIQRALGLRGVTRFYTHQAESITNVRAGRHTVVTARTAGGKSLAFQVPILESLLEPEGATALLLYPTKALAQDQLRSFRRMGEEIPALLAGTYDGDTAGHARRKLRESGNVILTNPDMLHVGILPYHGRWFRFLERLRYVVLDEAHVYRGIFGSHVAQVVRRLRRVLAHYDVYPTFVLSSATIGNPGDLARDLVGEDVVVVDRDGSPEGPRTFVFWNPPKNRGEAPGSDRRSSNGEAEAWLTELVVRGHPTIAFTKSRVVTELIYRYATESLAREGRGLADRVRPYRSGYLPTDRREIERRLFSGDLLGVVATSALELGIDVGGLDAAILVGFPETVASTLQRAGRAGRTGDESLVVLVAYNEPIDQYLVRRPQEILGKNPEHAVVDLENPYILAGQLACAAAELPLTPGDARHFGAPVEAIAEILADEGKLKKLEGQWFYIGEEFPAAVVSLRNMSDDTYTIVDVTKNHGRISRNAVIGQVDATSAPELLYPEAIYLHDGRAHFVRELDLEQKVAFVEPREVDYYTQAIVDDRIRVARERESTVIGPSETVAFGELEVHWATVAFKKIQFRSLDSIGFHALDLPYQELETTGFWYAPGPVAGVLNARNLSVREGLAGLRNVIGHLVPRFVMCDRADVGTVLEAGALGRTALYVYDRYPGGLGFSERAFARLEEILAAGLELVSACPCAIGCPSCVGVPPLDPGAHDDPEVRVRPGIPGKAATRALLEALARAPDSRRRAASRSRPAASRTEAPGIAP